MISDSEIIEIVEVMAKVTPATAKESYWKLMSFCDKYSPEEIRSAMNELINDAINDAKALARKGEDEDIVYVCEAVAMYAFLTGFSSGWKVGKEAGAVDGAVRQAKADGSNVIIV